jgi:hypothetical protein
MNRFPLPSDDRLEQLLRDSFESMPGPDMRRIELLERKLVRTGSTPAKNRVNTLPWWIVLLLGGGIAAATWWVGDIILDNNARPVIPQESGLIVPADQPVDAATSTADDPQVQQNAEATNRESPVIYQSEGL